jgi:hypothetical protein
MTEAWPQYVIAAFMAVGAGETSGVLLRPAHSFSTIPGRHERSLALFAEASKVLLPRAA